MSVSYVAATLTRLLTLVFLPLGLFATAIVYWSAHQEQTRAESGLVDTTRALALAVDRQLAIHGAALAALAESAALRRGDLPAFHDYAKRVGDQYDSWVVMLDESGQQLVNTRLPWGAPLPRVADTQTIAKVFSDRRPVVSDLFVGTVVKQPLVSVNVPVLRDDRVVYALDMIVTPDALTRLLQRHPIPAGWVAGIVDSKGQTVAWTVDSASRVGRPASPWLVEALAAMPQGLAEGEAESGDVQRIAFARLSDAPLSVALAAPASAMAVWHHGPLAVFVLGGTALFAALVYLGGWQANRLTRMLSSMVVTDEALRVEPARPGRVEGLSRPLETYGVAAASVALVIVLRLLLDPILGDRFVLLPLFPAVAVAVWYGGVGPGLFAIVAGYLAANYFFLEPRYGFTWAEPVESIGLWLFVASNLVILALGARARRSEAAERERAAQAESGQALLSTLLEHAPIGITVAGGPPGFPIIANSRSAVELTGRSAEQLVGMPVGAHEKAFGFHLPDGDHQLPPEATPLFRACRGESVLDQEGLVVRPDGSRIAVSMAAVPIRDTAGRIVGAIKCWYDITQRKAAEEALREADVRKDAFLATLAHELRNPLAAIRNALMFLSQPGIPEATARRGQEIAVRQVGQLTRLVDDLLDVSRITLGKIDLVLEPESLPDIVEEAAESCRPHFEKAHHELTVESPREPVWVAADRARLVQVLTNILVNSAKYTPPGGHIALTCAADEAAATVRVRDDGIGISAEFLPRVFEPFQQGEVGADDIQGGLGVGLTLVKQLVEMHGGSVEASSPGRGKGSTFTVRLPRIEAPAGAAAAASAPAQASGIAGHGRSRRVLVVDDNVDAAESTSILLRLHGHAVRHVSDGHQALEVARAFLPDVMVVDLGMPGMSGYEVARRIRDTPELTHVLLIALTGWGHETHRSQTAEAGFDHHLVKPVAPNVLNDLVLSPNGRRAEDAA